MLNLSVPGGYNNILLHSCCAPCSGAVIECLLQNGLRPTVFFSNSNIVPREEYELRLSELRRYCNSLNVQLIEDEYDHDAWMDFVLKRHEADAAEQKRLAEMPERGPRCLNCFKFRLMRAARYAAANGFPVLTTTLASSRWKSLDQVDEAGRWATAGGSESVPPEDSRRSVATAGVSEGIAPQSPGGAGGSESVPPEDSRRSIATAGVSEGIAPQSPGGAGGSNVVPPEDDVLWWNQNWRRGGLQPRRSEIICEQNFYNQTYCGCEFSKRHD